MTARLVITLGIVTAIIVIGGIAIARPSMAPTQLAPESTLSPNRAADSPVTQPAATTLHSRDIKNVPPPFAFSASIPRTWQAEAITDIAAISLYDPAAPGASDLEKSQIFIRTFTANDFLTLTTVTVFSREPLTIQGRPAVRYVIEKKPTAAKFPAQPAWRNGRHEVTDIRTTDTNPAVFYVIAKRPDVPDEIFQHFLNTLRYD